VNGVAGLVAANAPGELVVLYANGFGPTSVQVVSGSSTQSGMLATRSSKSATCQRRCSLPAWLPPAYFSSSSKTMKLIWVASRPWSW
jgi:hypothetical protein